MLPSEKVPGLIKQILNMSLIYKHSKNDNSTEIKCTDRMARLIFVDLKHHAANSQHCLCLFHHFSRLFPVDFSVGFYFFCPSLPQRALPGQKNYVVLCSVL